GGGAEEQGGVRGGSEPDGGADGSAASGASKKGWASLLTRIDAEEGLMPADGTVMVNAVDIFKSRAPAPGEPPVLYGMPVPAAINAVIGVADSPFLDLVAEFKTDAPAGQWQTPWPIRQCKLRSDPLLGLPRF